MKLAIIGGHVIDPKNGIDKVTDILIENGKVSTESCTLLLSPQLVGP